LRRERSFFIDTPHKARRWTGRLGSVIILASHVERAMDGAGWLRGLGLGRYDANFRDNKIDSDMPPRLTRDDLKDIIVSFLAIGYGTRSLHLLPQSLLRTSPFPLQSSRRTRVLHLGCCTRGYGRMFLDHIGRADDGCDFDFLKVGAATAGTEIH
jgi:hypothetical protein